MSSVAVKAQSGAPSAFPRALLPLSKAPIWALQRHYFDRTGIAAWRGNIVPSYVTTNPFCAGTYAEMLRDLFAGQDGPVDVVELGAGSGRFAYALLTRLFEGEGPPPPLRYIMTDVSEANIAFWRAHPDFARFIAAGRLDFARFDVETGDELVLQVSGRRLRPDAPAATLAVIANYVFDGTTQDLFAVAAGELTELLVEADGLPMPGAGREGEDLEVPALAYRSMPCPPDRYADPAWNGLLERYRKALGQGAFLLPGGALACLSRLRRLSAGAFVTLTCDRGRTRLEDYEAEPPPQPLSHGSFSFEVNYDALAGWTRASGGLALLPEAHASIAVAALALGLDAAGERRLAESYRRHVRTFGPDDFFVLKQAFDRDWETMNLRQLIAFLRLSAWDPTVFTICYDGLVTRLADATVRERRTLTEGVKAMWKHYLHLGEDVDLAFRAGGLLAGLGAFADAIPFFELSLKRHGKDPSTRKNLAYCRRRAAENGGC